jgi:hypothetical protein
VKFSRKETRRDKEGEGEEENKALPQLLAQSSLSAYRAASTRPAHGVAVLADWIVKRVGR